MNIDILTLYYLFSLGNIFTVLFFSFYVIIYRFKNPIVNIFIISKILYSILWVLFALRNEISWIYSIAIANIFLIFSVFYDIYCIAMANKKFNSYNFKKANLLPIVFSIVFLSVINQPTSTRIMVMSIIIFIIYIGGAIVLYLFKSSKTKIQRLSGVLCLIIAILFLFRTAWVFYEAKTVIIFTNNYFQIISYIFLFLGSFIFPMALLLVLKEKDEVKMKKDNKKLQELNNSKNKFFSIIAHDLKGPLGTYSGLGKILLDKHNEMSSEKRELFLKQIYDSSKETYNLLENLLHWANSESGSLVPVPSEINLHELIKQSENLLLQNISNKKLKLTVTLDTNITVFADYNMTFTIIRNLLSNAIKFTPEGGEIHISSLEKNENYVQILVEDTGVGISKENLEDIMEVHSGFSTKGTNNEKGTGLGLKLIKEFVEKNEGKIKIESEVNEGTKISILLLKNKRP